MDRRQYLRHFMIMLAGSGAAQAVNLLSYPLLARLYTPHDFGAFAIFLAATAIPGSLACARFDLAIQIAPRWGRFGTLWLCILVSTGAGLLTAAGAAAYWHLRDIRVETGFPALVGLAVFLTGLCAALSAYLLSHDQYRPVSVAVIVRTLTTVAVQVSLAFVAATSFSLILGFVIGFTAQGAALAVRVWSRFHPGAPRLRDMRAMFYRFRRQVSLDVPSALLATLSQNLLTIFLGLLYDQRTVGFYSIGYRIAVAPIQLFNDAVGQTFFQKAARAHETKGHFWDEMKFSLLTSGLLSLAVLVGIVLLARPLVVLYLGPAWGPSATILIILAPMLAVASIAQSSSTAAFVLKKTHWRLMHMIALVTLHVSLFALAYAFHWAVYPYLTAVSAGLCLAWGGYLVLLLAAARAAASASRHRPEDYGATAVSPKET